MPKEAITDAEIRTDVVWMRGRFAQIGVVSKNPIDDIADTHGEYSLWSDLSVDDIDRLVKVLRRVKRQLLLEPLPPE